MLCPVRVQGPGAAEEIATAISELNHYGEVEVLIVGRGGGSLEDLWAFNEEIVARAIFESGIPVISAVGHEIDYSISDFVADRRAPTPSAAAEMVVPDRKELLGVLAYYDEKFAEILKQRIQTARDRIEGYRKSYGFRKPEDVIYQKMQRLDEIGRTMQISLQHLLQMKRQKMLNLSRQLQALSPLDVLKRGYSICYRDGEIIKDIKQIHMLDLVQVRLFRGQFLSQIQMLGESE
jgi:exodeoxyribonuclease VII large subunit